MNENINLVEILKDCPKGTKLYSTIYGNVEFNCVEDGCAYPIVIDTIQFCNNARTTADGRMYKRCDGECTLFPSKDQRDWSKFKLKKLKFDPKTLQPFDKVLVRECKCKKWICYFFSHEEFCSYYTGGIGWKYCIPYNDETKHLVGTTEEAPEYYRYWEE